MLLKNEILIDFQKREGLKFIEFFFVYTGCLLNYIFEGVDSIF